VPRSKFAITAKKMAFATWSRSGGRSVCIRLDNAGGYARAANRPVCVTLTGEELARVLEGIPLTDCPNEVWAAIVRVRGFLAGT
jgi:hypothetical protein